MLKKKKSVFNKKNDFKIIKQRYSSTGPGIRKSACLKKYNDFSNTRSTLKVKSIYGFSR